MKVWLKVLSIVPSAPTPTVQLVSVPSSITVRPVLPADTYTLQSCGLLPSPLVNSISMLSTAV